VSPSIRPDSGRPASRPRRRPPGPWSAWIAVGAIVAFALLGFAVSGQGAIAFDDQVIALVKALPISVDAWMVITAAGGAVLVPIGLVLVLVLLALRRWRMAVVYAVALVGASAWTYLVKITIARERPAGSLVVAPGFSFPSGHSLNSAVTYGLIALLVWRTGWPTWLRVSSAIALTSLVILIGLSRIALGAHYPSDVLGGWLAGIAIVATVATFTRTDPDVAAEDRGANLPEGQPEERPQASR
jgi:membrane-associated phospholipid phosphatase